MIPGMIDGRRIVEDVAWYYVGHSVACMDWEDGGQPEGSS